MFGELGFILMAYFIGMLFIVVSGIIFIVRGQNGCKFSRGNSFSSKAL